MADPKPVTIATLAALRSTIADMPINSAHVLTIEDVVADCYDVIREARTAKKQSFENIAKVLAENGFKISERRLKKVFEDLEKTREQDATKATTAQAMPRSKSAKPAAAAPTPMSAG